ncbi:hypothetical protein [Nostoc sp.]
MFDIGRPFNRLGSKPPRLHILIASKAGNTERDIVKNFSNNWKTEAFTQYRRSRSTLHCPSVKRKLTQFFLSEKFSHRKTLGSMRAIALDDKMYMLKTMSPLKSRT